MRFLLIPGNNSLSHIAKCLALEHALGARGHTALIAVSRKNAAFMEQVGAAHAVLPDIQEQDGSGLPTVEWFRDSRRIGECIAAEIDLISRFRPDRVLGVFRFTLTASARAAGVPCDTLLCACMLPGCDEPLGFRNGEPGSADQRIILDGFYRYAGAQASKAFRRFGAGAVADVRELLVGERTFLWDFPEFMPFRSENGIEHVGPISSGRWPYDAIDINGIVRKNPSLAIVAFGTCPSQSAVTARVTRVLAGMGYHVLVAAGGQHQRLDGIPRNGSVTLCRFAPLAALFPHASLLVTHGGQMTVFEALRDGVPVVVMPFQPEQAHNGVCLERIGCGGRLIPSQCFQGNSAAYVSALDGMTDGEIAARITAVTGRPGLRERLAEIGDAIRSYRSIETLTERIERPVA